MHLGFPEKKLHALNNTQICTSVVLQQNKLHQRVLWQESEVLTLKFKSTVRIARNKKITASNKHGHIGRALFYRNKNVINIGPRPTGNPQGKVKCSLSCGRMQLFSLKITPWPFGWQKLFALKLFGL